MCLGEPRGVTPWVRPVSPNRLSRLLLGKGAVWEVRAGVFFKFLPTRVNGSAPSSKIIALESRIVLDKRPFGCREVANLCSVNRPWVRPLLSAPTENCTMSVFTSTNNEALGKLLTGMFPSVALSGVGVALLAAQISDLGGRCATMQRARVDPKRPKRKRHAGAASTAARKI